MTIFSNEYIENVNIKSINSIVSTIYYNYDFKIISRND